MDITPDIVNPFGLLHKEQENEKRPPITAKFEIPYFTVSGIQVRYLKIVEKSGYQALPWVRYITQNGDDYRFVLCSSMIFFVDKILSLQLTNRIREGQRPDSAVQLILSYRCKPFLPLCLCCYYRYFGNENQGRINNSIKETYILMLLDNSTKFPQHDFLPGIIAILRFLN